MKLRTLRRTAVLMLAAVTCCAVLAGCSTAESSAEKKEHSAPSYSPTIPENPVDSNAPGTDHLSDHGTAIDYDSKLSVSLDRVVEMDDVDKTTMRVLFAEMTITNNSDAAVDCSTLTHFRAIIDGEESMDAVSNVQAAVLCRKYCSAVNNGLLSFNQAIDPGQSVHGYVYLGLPAKWDTLQLAYTPYKYYSNDRLIFDLNESEFEHFSNAQS